MSENFYLPPQPHEDILLENPNWINNSSLLQIYNQVVVNVTTMQAEIELLKESITKIEDQRGDAIKSRKLIITKEPVSYESYLAMPNQDLTELQLEVAAIEILIHELGQQSANMSYQIQNIERNIVVEYYTAMGIQIAPNLVKLLAIEVQIRELQSSFMRPYPAINRLATRHQVRDWQLYLRYSFEKFNNTLPLHQLQRWKDRLDTFRFRKSL